jgi:hypothetical protein
VLLFLQQGRKGVRDVPATNKEKGRALGAACIAEK